VADLAGSRPGRDRGPGLSGGGGVTGPQLEAGVWDVEQAWWAAGFRLSVEQRYAIAEVWVRLIHGLHEQRRTARPARARQISRAIRQAEFAVRLLEFGPL